MVSLASSFRKPKSSFKPTVFEKLNSRKNNIFFLLFTNTESLGNPEVLWPDGLLTKNQKNMPKILPDELDVPLKI